MEPSAVSLRQVRFRYPRAGGAPFELVPPNLAIGRGERVAVVGPSGVGKSTFARLLAGILVPQEGTVAVGHRDLQPRRRRPAGLPGPAGRLRLPALRAAGLSVRPRQRAAALPAQPGPAAGAASPGPRRPAPGGGRPHRRRPPPARLLSQGEQQRVGICRALVTRAPLIIADEPTGNLDGRTTDRILDLLFHRLQPDHTLVMITHDAGLLHRFDRTLDVSEWTP
ncbi:MAG: ATP-binding cassette domain-containing protein [bacterium]